MLCLNIMRCGWGKMIAHDTRIVQDDMMNTLETLDLPWEVITLLGVDRIAPADLHLYNAVLYGIAERHKRHGLEWIRAHAHEIRIEICASAKYAGLDFCQTVSDSKEWMEACSDAAALLDAARSEPAHGAPLRTGTDSGKR